MMYCIVWKYTVTSNQLAFEKAYSRKGVWFKFFEPCEDYLGHELMKSEDKKTYLLTEKWMSKEDFEDFISKNQAKYQEIEMKTRELYDEEVSLGTYYII
ncbi:MAG: hypothetical protein AAF600_16160 [Bacteroidota bacterium]